MTAGILTFFDGSTNKLTSPSDVISYLVYFWKNNPGNTTDMYRDMQLSLRHTLATHSGNPEKTAQLAQQELNDAILRYFPDKLVDVTVTAESILESVVNFKLIVDIQLDEHHVIDRHIVTIEDSVIKEN